MKEIDYIKTMNYTQILTALSALDQVCADEDAGVSEGELVEIIKKLRAMQDRIYWLIDIDRNR